MRCMLLSMAWLALAAAPVPAAEPADLVLRGGHVVTLAAGGLPACTALAVRAGRIVYAGDDAGARAWIGPSTRVIDLDGMTVVPGLVDAHAHLDNLGRILREPNLIGTTSIAEVVRRVQAFQKQVPEGAWIHGRGWDQNDWERKSFPSWRDLAATEKNPVYLDRVDGHALWINRRAMDAAGITRSTPDPPGGRVVRDADGEPTGVLVDQAEMLVESKVPDPSADELDARLGAAIEECNRVGLTGVHDAGTTRAVLESLRRLHARARLTLNVYGLIDRHEPDFARERLAAGPSVEAGGRIVLRCFKLRADGALGSRGAALLEPYADDADNRGLDVDPADSLLAWTVAALRHGFQVGAHAIGDRGNRVVLDAYEAALKTVPARDARLRIEHAQVLSPADLERFAPLGVIASMQPTHATSDMLWAQERLGAPRLRGAYAWRSLLDRGVVLAFGSDAPVESVDPRLGLYAAVTRQYAEGMPAGGWFAQQRVTVEEAVRAFTWGAAYAAFDENDAGSIGVGRRADLTVFDRDIFRASPRELLATRAVLTVVRGAVVYDGR